MFKIGDKLQLVKITKTSDPIVTIQLTIEKCYIATADERTRSCDNGKSCVMINDDQGMSYFWYAEDFVLHVEKKQIDYMQIAKDVCGV